MKVHHCSQGWIFVFVALLAALVSPAPGVLAQEKKPAPALAFTEDSLLTIELDSNSGKPATLTVWIANNGDAPATNVTASVRLEGLVAITQPPTSDATDIAPGKVAQFDISLESLDTLPAGSHNGAIVASADDLAPVVRDVTVTVPDAPPIQGPFLADGMEEVSIRGTSLWPSFLNPLYDDSVLWWLGLVATLALTWIVAWSLLPERWSSGGSISTLVLAILIILTLAIGSDRAWGTPSRFRVDTPGVPLTGAGVPPDGVVTSADGGEAEVTVADEKLRVTGVPRAGTYAGTLDFVPGEEAGSVPIEVKVRDAWPWAIGAIALGVVIGWTVTHYAERRRPAGIARVEAARLWDAILAADSRFQVEHGDRPYAAYRMTAHARSQLDQVTTAIERGAFDGETGATTLLANLDGYHVAFERFRTRLVNLDRMTTALRSPAKRISADIVASLTSALAVEAATDILSGNKLAGAAELLSPEDLTEVEAATAETTTWINDLDDALEAIANGLARIGPCPDTASSNTASDDDKELYKRCQELVALAEESLQVDAEKVKEIPARALDIVRAHTPVADTAFNIGQGVKAWSAISPAVVAPATITPRAIDATPTRRTPPFTADDLIEFSAGLPGGAAPRVLTWDFGDGLVAPVANPGERRATTIRHRYAAPGIYEVVIRDGGGETVAGPASITIAGDQGAYTRLKAVARLNERNMGLIAGALAIASGFVALYFTSDTWGAPQDYISAILWGSVVSEGLKQVPRLAGWLGMLRGGA